LPICQNQIKDFQGPTRALLADYLEFTVFIHGNVTRLQILHSNNNYY